VGPVAIGEGITVLN